MAFRGLAREQGTTANPRDATAASTATSAGGSGGGGGSSDGGGGSGGGEGSFIGPFIGPLDDPIIVVQHFVRSLWRMNQQQQHRQLQLQHPPYPQQCQRSGAGYSAGGGAGEPRCPAVLLWEFTGANEAGNSLGINHRNNAYPGGGRIGRPPQPWQPPKPISPQSYLYLSRLPRVGLVPSQVCVLIQCVLFGGGGYQFMCYKAVFKY